MNYQKHYDLLIERARWRLLIGYGENHRILPGCMGGTYTKSNVVRLTAEEHFVAHQLLVKMHPKNYLLAHAAWGMTAGPKGKRNGNKKFGWLKRRHAEAMSILHTGKKASAETRAKQSVSSKGKKKSAEHCANISAGQKGKKFSAETRAIIGAHQKGRKASAESRAKQSISRSKPWSVERKASYRKENNPMFGKRHSAEVRAKQSVARRESWIRSQATKK